MPPPTTPLEEDVRPATLAEHRNLRRWVMVAAVWAAAATAIALIALLDRGDGDKSADQSSRATARRVAGVARAQSQLDRRLKRLDAQIRSMPQSDDLSKLDKRVRQVEKSASKATKEAGEAKSQLSDLEDRIDKLKTSSSPSGSTTTPDDSGGGASNPDEATP